MEVWGQMNYLDPTDPNGGPYRKYTMEAHVAFLVDQEALLRTKIARLEEENARLRRPPLWRRIYKSGAFQQVMNLLFLLLCWCAGVVLLVACLATIGLFGRFLYWSVIVYSDHAAVSSYGPVICPRIYSSPIYDAGTVVGVPYPPKVD